MIKQVFAVLFAFIASAAMANGTYYQSPGGGVYFNNSNPAYGNPQPVQRVVPVYPAYQQNNQLYQQYQTQPQTVNNYSSYPQNNYQQYRTSPQQPREYYERDNDAQKFNECRRRWERSGLRARYDRGAGCMVEVDGYLVPERNVQVKVHR